MDIIDLEEIQGKGDFKVKSLQDLEKYARLVGRVEKRVEGEDAKKEFVEEFVAFGLKKARELYTDEIKQHVDETGLIYDLEDALTEEEISAIVKDHSECDYAIMLPAELSGWRCYDRGVDYSDDIDKLYASNGMFFKVIQHALDKATDLAAQAEAAEVQDRADYNEIFTKYISAYAAAETKTDKAKAVDLARAELKARFSYSANKSDLEFALASGKLMDYDKTVGFDF
jgi:hypothetical protein